MKQQAQADRRWAKLQAATANYERKMGRERAASERAVTMVDNSSLGARSARRHTGVARRNPLTACFRCARGCEGLFVKEMQPLQATEAFTGGVGSLPVLMPVVLCCV